MQNSNQKLRDAAGEVGAATKKAEPDSASTRTISFAPDDQTLAAILTRMSAAKSRPEATAVAKKKKPGRPKKENIMATMACFGIRPEPLQADNIVELVSSRPFVFRKIVALVNCVKAGEILFCFEPEGLTVTAKDHAGNPIVAKCHGALLNHYFCRAPFRVAIGCLAVNKVFLSPITKNTYSISMNIHQEHERRLVVSICDWPYLTHDYYTLDTIESKVAPPADGTDVVKDYPITFSLSHAFFKAKINNLRKISKTMVFTQCPGAPFEIFLDSTSNMNVTSRFAASELIQLQNRLPPDGSLTATVAIDKIKPFLACNSAEQLTIALDHRRPIIMFADLERNDSGKPLARVSVTIPLGGSNLM